MKFKHSKLFSRYLPLTLAVLGLVIAGSTYLTLRKSTPTAEAGWYNSSWTYRKPITIDHTKISQTATTTFSNFPLLINVTDTDLKYTGSGGKVGTTNGQDILFTSSDGTTKLDHEIEKYASTTGETIAWVRIPTMHATYDDVIYIYFGNSGASDQQNKTGVWDSNYKGVWHMKEQTVSGAANDTFYDSTSNANNLSEAGTTQLDSDTMQIDGSINKNATTEWFTTNITIPAASDFTFSTWLNISSYDGSNPGIWREGASGSGTTFLIFQSTTGRPWIRLNSSDVLKPASGYSLPTNSLAYVNFVARSSSNAQFYVNGDLKHTATHAIAVPSASVQIIGWQYSSAEAVNGIYDEFRISTTARSADWITTEYNNQFSPSTFYSYGTLGIQTRSGASGKVSSQSSSLGWYSTGGTWTNRKAITIDHTKISQTATTTFSNFPLLINVTDTDLKYTDSGGKVASSTGADILFTSSDGTTKLDHEIEKYASTTGETIAWVRIPTMHATYDDVIYIYFGNSGASDQQNKTGVWDSNYKGVWHLSETDVVNGSGTYKDSTSNGINLSLTDTDGDSTGAVVGKIGNAIKPSTDDYDYFFNNSTSVLNNLPNNGGLTVSVWARIDGSASTLVSKRNQDAGNGWRFGFYQTTRLILSDTWSDKIQDWYTGLNIYTAGITDYYVFTYDGSNNTNNPVMYFNARAQSISNSDSAGTRNDDSASFLVIGNQQGCCRDTNGMIDEVRISNSIRSADWITTEYNNQFSPSTFYSYGATQTSARQNSSGSSAPAIKVRGGVKFR